MHFPHQILVAGLLASVSSATPDPQYQKPTTISIANDVSRDMTNACGASTFNVLAGQHGDIATSDCLLIAQGWANMSAFALFASGWVNSTADADHFYTYKTQGTCEFAFKRTDGLQDLVTIGSSDFTDLMGSAIGGSSATIQPVEGVMPCKSASGSAQIEWTVRTPM